MLVEHSVGVLDVGIGELLDDFLKRSESSDDLIERYISKVFGG